MTKSTDININTSTTSGVTTLSTTQTTQNLTTPSPPTTPPPVSSSSPAETTSEQTTTVSYTGATENTSYVHTEERSGEQDGMPPAAIAGVAVGVCVALFIVVLLTVLYRKRRKRPPRPTPILPSASDVDKTIHKLKSHDVTESGIPNPESLYKNLDTDGNPTDNTNPHVGDDGYLKKKEMKKKEKKKKTNNKFDKKKAKTHQDSSIDLGVQNIHPNTTRTVSDASYSEGRSPELVEGAYDTGKVKDESLYVNTQDNTKGYANLEGIRGDTDETGLNYYNLQDNKGPTEIYENP